MGLCKDCRYYKFKGPGYKGIGYCMYWKKPKYPGQTSRAFRRR